MPCHEPLKVFVPSGWDYKEITVRCGNTSPSGDPFLCEKCAKKFQNRNWRLEAEENGERYDPLD